MVIGYARVSTEEQNLARQEELLERMGAEKIYSEKVSGKDTNRPKLLEMMDFVREGDTVVVESYSRLARSTKDLLDIISNLEGRGVKFISQKENINTSEPQGRLMLTIFAGLAQFERECALQRQKEGIAIAKRLGKYTGRPPKKLDNFEEIYEACKKKEISFTQGSKLLGVSRSTFYRRINEYEDSQAKEG